MPISMLTVSGRRHVTPTHPRGRSLRLRPSVFVVVALVVAIGVVAGAQLRGSWATSGRASATASSPGSDSGSLTSASNPDEVKGWMTVSDVVTAFHVTPAEVYAAFSVPTTTPTSTELKDLEQLSDGAFEIAAFRTWLAGHTPPR